jgi:hypothetical protein
MTYFMLGRIMNKDNIGAMKIAAGIFLLALLTLSAGCTVAREYQPWMEAGLAYEVAGTVGNNPVCVVRLRQPIGFGKLEPDWLMIGYTHHSSCPDLNDRATVDQLEVVAKIPLGRRK